MSADQPAVTMDDLKADHRLAFRPDEAAATLGISRTKLYEWMRCGKIPAYKDQKTVLILKDDLIEAVKAGVPYVDAI